MPNRLAFASTILAAISGLLLAQAPESPRPPALLPPSVTGKPYEAVTPTSAVAAKVSPIDRFRTPGQTGAALEALQSAKEAAAWLTRMCKVDGRFVPGLDATLQRELTGTEAQQAQACLALARMARFSGDDKMNAAASQACLTLLTLTKLDAKEQSIRMPNLAADRGGKVAFASLLAMSIYELPHADAKLTLEAHKLTRYLYTLLREDGSVEIAEGDDAAKLLEPGLCFQALMTSDRVTTEAWKREALGRGVTHFAAKFAASKNMSLCCTLLPAVCDYALQVKSEPANAFALEMADYLCDRQYTVTDARQRGWVGAFKPTTGDEPNMLTADALQGLSAAITLTTQIPDATRFQRYRTVATAGFSFARTLQFNETNAKHFERQFRTLYLSGGGHGSPTDGAIRAEHTASLLSAQLRFLESGGEKQE